MEALLARLDALAKKPSRIELRCRELSATFDPKLAIDAWYNALAEAAENPLHSSDTEKIRQDAHESLLELTRMLRRASASLRPRRRDSPFAFEAHPETRAGDRSVARR